MTDFELISLHIEQIRLFIDVLTLVTTLLFSFLVGMYFIARRLSSFLFWVLNVMFLMVMLLLTRAVYSTATRGRDISLELISRIAAEDGQISWMSVMAMPEYAPQFMRAVFVCGALLAVIFAIVHRRNKTHNR
jgi:hypothetical protein